jgi:4-hydroxy-tetrahydrodipicolinate synthase
MREKYPLRGIVVSLNTPYDDQGAVDLPALERLVDWHIGQGAAGFLAPAYAGEVYDLSFSERLEIYRAVRSASAGRAELFAGATAEEEKTSRRAVEEASRLGADGVLLEVPLDLKGRNADVLAYFRRMAEVGMPTLMIQDWDWSGPGMDVPLVKELFETIPAFRCLKVEVRPAGPKYTAVIEATDGRLHVSGGWAADQMLESLDRGVDVIMPTAMTGLYRRVYDCWHRGERDEAREIFKSILPVLAFTRQHIDVSVHFYKRLFHRLGIFRTTRTRRPASGYDAFHERQGEWLLEHLETIETEAGLRQGNR